MQIFDELVRDVGGFDSDFHKRIKGASQQSIETLRQMAAPNVLSEVYLDSDLTFLAVIMK